MSICKGYADARVLVEGIIIIYIDTIRKVMVTGSLILCVINSLMKPLLSLLHNIPHNNIIGLLTLQNV